MPQIQVTFNGEAQDLQDFCDATGYEDQVLNDEGKMVSNPETKVDYFKRKTKEYVWKTVYSQRVKAAANTAKNNVSEVEF